MIPEDHQAIFSTYAREKWGSKACEWHDDPMSVRSVAMESFYNLHADTPDLIQGLTGRKLLCALGIVIDDKANAFAARKQDSYVIGITTGLEKAIQNLVNWAFIKPYVFRDGDRDQSFLATTLERIILAGEPERDAEDFYSGDLHLLNDRKRQLAAPGAIRTRDVCLWKVVQF